MKVAIRCLLAAASLFSIVVRAADPPSLAAFCATEPASTSPELLAQWEKYCPDYFAQVASVQAAQIQLSVGTAEETAAQAKRKNQLDNINSVSQTIASALPESKTPAATTSSTDAAALKFIGTGMISKLTFDAASDVGTYAVPNGKLIWANTAGYSTMMSSTVDADAVSRTISEATQVMSNLSSCEDDSPFHIPPNMSGNPFTADLAISTAAVAVQAADALTAAFGDIGKRLQPNPISTFDAGNPTAQADIISAALEIKGIRTSLPPLDKSPLLKDYKAAFDLYVKNSSNQKAVGNDDSASVKACKTTAQTVLKSVGTNLTALDTAPNGGTSPLEIAAMKEELKAWKVLRTVVANSGGAMVIYDPPGLFNQGQLKARSEVRLVWSVVDPSASQDQTPATQSSATSPTTGGIVSKFSECWINVNNETKDSDIKIGDCDGDIGS